jgi:hypothetical protein
MSITDEKEPAQELATLVLSVPPDRIGELKALASFKTMVARANADDYENRKESLRVEYWRKEEAFWANIREQLNQ